MEEITVEELAKLRANKEDFQLIDVREQYEFDTCNLGGELISLGEIPYHVDRISRIKKVILYCKSGSRSLNVTRWLKENHGFNNVYSLKGGIVAWADRIDPSIGDCF